MTAHSAHDVRFMQRALGLGARGLGRTWPNPPVGAVFVRAGRIVGEGFHTSAGAPHAEIEALCAAGGRARGADLYVTLEPCTHFGRTPPCVDALLGLGLRRVVVGTPDPDPRVRGRGIRRLRAAGVEVRVGACADEAERLVAGFRSRILRGRPYVTLKLAASLDGRIATASGDARWITGPAARRVAHALRDVSDAVLVGAATVRVDDPRLTCRLPGGHDPVRVVLAGRTSRLPSRARLFLPGSPPTWVVAPAGPGGGRFAPLARRGVEIIRIPSAAQRPAVAAVMRVLGSRGVTSLLIEGGGTVAAAALRAGVVDRLVVFLAPKLLGGDAVPMVGALGLRRIADAIQLVDVTVGGVGPDVVVEARVRSRPPAFASPRTAR